MWNLDKINAFELAEYLLAKFTHDIAGTLGAIENSLDYIESDDLEIRKSGRDLLYASSHQAIIKLKFFRQAYGNGNAVHSADISNLKYISEEFLKITKNSLNWEINQNIEISVNSGKLLLNIIYLFNKCLLKGGNISVIVTSKDIQVSAKADRLKIPNDYQQLIIERNRSDLILDAKNIHTYYTSILADNINAKVKYSINEGNLAANIAL